MNSSVEGVTSRFESTRTLIHVYLLARSGRPASDLSSLVGSDRPLSQMNSPNLHRYLLDALVLLVRLDICEHHRPSRPSNT